MPLSQLPIARITYWIYDFVFAPERFPFIFHLVFCTAVVAPLVFQDIKGDSKSLFVRRSRDRETQRPATGHCPAVDGPCFNMPLQALFDENHFNTHHERHKKRELYKLWFPLIPFFLDLTFLSIYADTSTTYLQDGYICEVSVW